ncbi:hypothetical protein [Methanooceanicella nereidis]|nr:hypothetical protein [Methanocella sp. CWC-04]
MTTLEKRLEEFWDVPENRGRVLMVLWYSSLGMLVLGYLIMAYLLFVE